MQVERYRIVLTGWVISGRQTQEVVSELSRLFKLPESRIRPLLMGEPSIIRRDLTLDKAEHLRNKIEKRGAVCSIKLVLRDLDKLCPDTHEHTGILEPDLNMESTQFILTEKPPQSGARLRPGFFSQQDARSEGRGPSRPTLLLLVGIVLIAGILVVYLL